MVRNNKLGYNLGLLTVLLQYLNVLLEYNDRNILVVEHGKLLEGHWPCQASSSLYVYMLLQSHIKFTSLSIFTNVVQDASHSSPEFSVLMY